VPSYRKKHIKNKLQKIRPKKSVFRKPWFWIIILCFAVVILGFYFLLFYSGLQVKNIIVYGNDKVATHDLQQAVLNNNGFEIVNLLNIRVLSRSIFLTNTSQLGKQILKTFPLIGSVTISKNFPQTLSLSVQERKPLGAYCNNDKDASKRCFLIDESGVIFKEINAADSNASYTIVRQELENSQIFVGEEVVAQTITNAIAKIQKDLKDNFQISLEEALITSPIRLNAKTKENWLIYFDISSNADIDSQLTRFNLLLNSGISQSDRKNLQYIDLRSKDRAIICDNKICGGESAAH
jgi:cell division septal protein FtsQ